LTNSLILPGVVAINYPKFDNEQNGCTKCGICQVGCPYDFIWSSDDFIRNEMNHIKYIKGEVINCIKNQNGLETVTYQQGKSILNLTSKKIFLCGGAIGNSKILLRTFSNINRITIRDNQTKIIAGLKLRVNTPSTKDSLAEFMVFDRNKKNKVIRYHT
jgi:ferredoxin